MDSQKHMSKILAALQAGFCEATHYANGNDKHVDATISTAAAIGIVLGLRMVNEYPHRARWLYNQLDNEIFDKLNKITTPPAVDLVIQKISEYADSLEKPIEIVSTLEALSKRSMEEPATLQPLAMPSMDDKGMVQWDQPWVQQEVDDERGDTGDTGSSA